MKFWSLWAITISLVMLCASRSMAGHITFSFDYSLDASGLFDNSTAGKAAQTAMDRASQTFSDRLLDNLTGITPGSGETWSARMTNPGTGLEIAAPLGGVQTNVIKVYIGSRTLSGLDVANTVIGTAASSGSQAFMDKAASRGQAGALTSPKTDFGPWGGSIAFDDATNWYFGASASGLTANKIDFQTVATHELEHLLGFSSSQPSWAALVASGKFNGAMAVAANGGTLPAVTGSHWLGMNSTVGPGGMAQVALMDAAVPTGVRRRMTQLDWGALGDIGWKLAMPGDANADGEVNFVDFQTLESWFGETNSRWAHGDFNEDGVVGSADLSLLLTNFGKGVNGTQAAMTAAEAAAIEGFEAQSVPEPAMVGLMGGLIVLAAGGRRRKRQTRRAAV